ncbi:hypothetical protein MNR01_05995 [Lysobacter sp. S4-A87]|uniref:hypothetical protein n=1 Tax=Lysobacter sp. S4-A87 TaxID=2925843 RepID=UPI001F53ACF2|nr:hypothetical protein [Lysobacter sp. S4-A87]UNK50556.1 hypothetical protein MNR01_05995 [Lysobacter sp. S4-A87]
MSRRIGMNRLREILDWHKGAPGADAWIRRDIEALLANPRERFADARALTVTLHAHWVRRRLPDGTLRPKPLTWTQTALALVNDPVRGPQCGFDPQRDVYDLAHELQRMQRTVRRKRLGRGRFLAK